jgi:hypothetical protein
MKFKSKQRNFLALTIASIIFPTSSFAIDGFNSCNALLTAGIYNTSQSNSSVDSQSVAKSSFCSADYSKVEKGSSQAASIEASYGMFGGGASGSVSSSQITETQRNVCTSGFNSSAYSSQASNFARNVYQGSLDAWNQCQKLSQQGVNFDLQIDQSMQGATVTLSTTSSGSTVNFNGVDQIGLGRSICTTTRNSNTGSSTGKVLTVDKTTSLKFNSASKLTITCERQMSSDGKGGLFADAQSLVFNTSAGSYQVPMVTIGLSPRVTVDQAVANLEAGMNTKLEKMKTDNQTAINNALTTSTNSINSLVNSVNSLNSSVSSLQNGVAMTEYKPVSTVQIGNCVSGFETNCISGASRYCQSKGYKAGFVFEAGAGNVAISCIK